MPLPPSQVLELQVYITKPTEAVNEIRVWYMGPTLQARATLWL